MGRHAKVARSPKIHNHSYYVMWELRLRENPLSALEERPRRRATFLKGGRREKATPFQVKFLRLRPARTGERGDPRNRDDVGRSGNFITEQFVN